MEATIGVIIVVAVVAVVGFVIWRRQQTVQAEHAARIEAANTREAEVWEREQRARAERDAPGSDG